MILVIDAYDSFVETLARYAREAGFATEVRRHDRTTLADCLAARPEAIILSPGPGRPEDAPLCGDLIVAAPDLPILGVCLGHQAMAEVYGGETRRHDDPHHGRSSLIHHEGDPLFAGVPDPFPAGRYHSLIACPGGNFRAIAWLDDGTPMAARHVHRPHFGVQFHPESLLTPHGRIILGNFLAIPGKKRRA
jgi:anthranilate synthase/aminodeoxychorismate synthase-like glutamine amidotransferase